MSTLAQINDTLAEQNDILYEVSGGVEKMSSNIESFLTEMQGNKLDQLEADREAANEKRRADKQQIDVQKSAPSANGISNPFDFSTFGGIGKLFTTGGLLGIGATIGKALLRRGLPALVLNTFAKEIADYVESETGSKEIGDAVFRGLKLGSIGLLFGKKFGLIGAALGVVLTDENRLKLGEIEKSIKDLGLKFDVELPSLESIIKKTTKAVGESLDFVNATLKGDLKGIEDNFAGFATTILGITALLAPGSLLRGAFAASKGSYNLIKGAMTAKAVADVATSGAATATAVSRGTMAARLAPFITNPAVLAALGVGALAWWINSYTEDQKEQLQQLQDRINTGADLSSDDWKLYQDLSSAYGKGATDKPGGNMGIEDFGPEGFDIERIKAENELKSRMEQRQANEDRATDRFGKFYGRGIGSWSNVYGIGLKYERFDDPRIIGKQSDFWRDVGTRKPLEKPAPIAATKMREELIEKEKVSTKPIVVIQDGGMNVQTTNVQNSQGLVMPTNPPIDYSDPFMIRGKYGFN